MSVERLERVLWRLGKNNKQGLFLLSEIEKAIMKECGTDPRTVKTNIKALLKLGWIKRENRYHFTITGEHLN